MEPLKVAVPLLATCILSTAVQAQELVVAIGSLQGPDDTHLTAFAIGGTAPYTYTWTNASRERMPTAGSMERLLTVARPGRYTVVVTDAAGRTAKATLLVRRNSEMVKERRELRRVQRKAAAYGDLRVKERDNYFRPIYSDEDPYGRLPVRNDGPSHRHRTVVP